MTTAQDFGRVAVLARRQGRGARDLADQRQRRAGGVRRRGVDAHPVDTAEPDALRAPRDWRLRARLRRAGNGRGGEDGVIQGALEAIGLPYTGQRRARLAIGMDKYRTKLVWPGGRPCRPRRSPCCVEKMISESRPAWDSAHDQARN